MNVHGHFYVVATELWWYFCSCQNKMDIYFILVRMLQHCRIKAENVFQRVFFMCYNSYHKRPILMVIKKFSWSFRRNLPEVDMCMWEFPMLHVLRFWEPSVIMWFDGSWGWLCQSVNRLLSPGWDAICLQRQWEPVRMYLHRRMVSTRLVLNG